MVLEVANGLFKQRDVRETATDTTASNSKKFVVWGDEAADLENSKILAASTGLDIGSTATQIYFSLEQASETNLGGATFDGTDFVVTAGDVTLATKTGYTTVAGINFQQLGGTYTVTVATELNPKLTSGANNQYVTAQIEIPDGATITACKVEGSSANTWYLALGSAAASSASTITSATVGTGTTGLSTVVDKSGGKYYYISVELDNGDYIYGAKVTYTYKP